MYCLDASIFKSYFGKHQELGKHDEQALRIPEIILEQGFGLCTMTGTVMFYVLR